jgi:hypothetical protein
MIRIVRLELDSAFIASSLQIFVPFCRTTQPPTALLSPPLASYSGFKPTGPKRNPSFRAGTANAMAAGL